MRACAAVYTRSIVDHVLSASAKSPVAMVERPREVLLADNSAGGIQDSGQERRRIRALDKCKKLVINPYFFILGILGWKTFSVEDAAKDSEKNLKKCIRVFIAIFWILVIGATFSTQIVTCFSRDEISIDEKENGTVLFVDCRKHVITTYPMFIFMIYLTYIFGIYLFSHGGDRQITALAEKVFVLATELQQNKNTLIGTMLGFLIGGAMWVLASLGLNLMTAFSFNMFNSTVEIHWPTEVISHTEKLGLVAYSVIGLSTLNIVYMAAVINYAAQTEMMIDLLNGIKTLVKRSFVDGNRYNNITTAMTDITKARKFLKTLNGTSATATAFILFNLASNVVLSSIDMDNNINSNDSMNLNNKTLAGATSFLHVFLWLALMLFPLVQAARVSYACKKLKETGAFIYTYDIDNIQNHRQDMDMYSNFVQSLTLRATLFGVPIYPWMMYGTLTATVFVILILFQTDTYSLWYVL